MTMIRIPLLRITVALAGIGLSTLPALAADRFEILDGTLIDHSTGLIWRGLSATAGTTLPLSPLQGEYRVASGDELSAVLPQTFGATTILSTVSDVYGALSFFAQTSPAASECPLPVAGGTCVNGWWYDGELNGHATYNVASFVYGPTGISGSVSFSSITTIGSYTSSFCPLSICNSPVGLFEVRAVPELPALVMFAAGLAIMWLEMGAGVRTKSDA